MRYPSVNVVPTSEAIRQNLKHPCGWGFEHPDNEGTPWPNDEFTQAAVERGEVTLIYPDTQRDDSSHPAVRPSGQND
jgi:hypothetical protein